MDVVVHQLSKGSDDEIIALVGARKALLVSSLKFDALPPNADYLSVHDFHIKSWRRDVDPLDYDLTVFRLQTVCAAVQFSFHSHQYRRVHVFVGKTETAGLLRCEADPRYKIICINTDLMAPEQRRVSGSGPADPLCPQDVRYRYVRKYIHKKIAIFSDTPRVFEDFPEAVDADVLEDRGEYTCIVYDFREGTDYSGFKETIFFVSEQDGEHTARNARGICTPEKIIGLRSIDQRFTNFLKVDTAHVGKARFPHTNSQQLLLFITNEIKGKLEKINLFVRDNDFVIGHEPGCAELYFPFFDLRVKSGFFIKKRDRVNDCCFRAIKHLHENGFIDDFLHVNEGVLRTMGTVQTLLCRAYGTADPHAIEEIKNGHLRCEDHGSRDELVERGGRLVYSAADTSKLQLHRFKRRYGVDLAAVEPPAGTGKTPVQQIEERYRKIPDSLQRDTDVFSLYVFSRGSTGILCSGSFDHYSSVDRSGCPVEIKVSGRHRLSGTQLLLVRFYQIIFFMLHKNLYRSSSQTVQYHYYAVPVTGGSHIDWAYLGQVYDDFILGSVADVPCVGDRLVWNPFSKVFLVHAGDYGRNIEDSFGAQTFLEYFENSYKVSLLRRTGPMVFRGCLLDQVVARRKRVLLHPRNAGGPNAAADGSAASIIASKEACFVTSVKESIIEESVLFISNFFVFDSVCIAHELNCFLGLGLPLGLLTQALTHSRDNGHCNYERLEFLGDCALKYTITNYLCLRGLPLGSVVSLKDSFISNDNLYSTVFRTGLFRFISTTASHHRMFQAPHVDGLDQFKQYFEAHRVFSSDNLGSYLGGIRASGPGLDKKVYADVVEAIIGCLMLVGGLEAVMRFLYRVGIVKTDDEQAVGDPSRLFVTGVFPYVSGFAMEYAGVLAEHEILEVQGIVRYDFRNRGFLERALTHPSYENNVFGSQDFQILELIGDSALDLFVVGKLYPDPSLCTPLHLHSAKKSYVNNRSLGMLVVHTDLVRYLSVGGSLDVPRDGWEKKKLPKAFGDVLEAILGAILCDVNWDFERFSQAVENGIWRLLETFRAEIECD